MAEFWKLWYNVFKKLSVSPYCCLPREPENLICIHSLSLIYYNSIHGIRMCWCRQTEPRNAPGPHRGTTSFQSCRIPCQREHRPLPEGMGPAPLRRPGRRCLPGPRHSGESPAPPSILGNWLAGAPGSLACVCAGPGRRMGALERRAVSSWVLDLPALIFFHRYFVGERLTRKGGHFHFPLA